MSTALTYGTGPVCSGALVRVAEPSMTLTSTPKYVGMHFLCMQARSGAQAHRRPGLRTGSHLGLHPGLHPQACTQACTHRLAPRPPPKLTPRHTGRPHLHTASHLHACQRTRKALASAPLLAVCTPTCACPAGSASHPQ